MADIFGILGGSSHPFGRDDLIARYADRAEFLARFEAAASRQRRAGPPAVGREGRSADEAAALVGRGGRRWCSGPAALDRRSATDTIHGGETPSLAAISRPWSSRRAAG